MSDERALVAHEKSRLGPRDEPEVLDQHPVEARLLRLVLAAQHGGWMKRGDRLLRPARGKEPAAVPEQAEIGGDDRARADVAPRQTSTSGLIAAISASIQGRQAASSLRRGVWWMRRLPRSTKLKCFTAFVT